MVIDFHYHFSPRKISEAMAIQRVEKHISIWARSAGIKEKRSIHELAKERMDMSDDPDGSKLLERMEKAGIDVTVAMLVDNVTLGMEEGTLLADHKILADLGKRYPDKIIPFASIDPRRKNAAELFRRSIEKYGMRGLKWHPDHGYSPASPEAYAVLKVAQELKIPLLTHTGGMYGNSKINYSHPLILDGVAVDFPELKIVAAHSGHLLWRDWCATSYFKRNLYGDLAEWQMFAVGHYDYFCRFLREAIDISGAEQIVFASDGPGFELLISNEQWVKIVKDLPLKAPHGIKFTSEEVSAILGGNARRILGI
jgi:predicted TIM-barrel fold metal-dependent hydrolase